MKNKVLVTRNLLQENEERVKKLFDVRLNKEEKIYTIDEVILIATGSEVSLALLAREKLVSEGIKCRVVSVPSIEWFMAEPESYRQQVLPNSIKARVSIEAGIAQSWYQLIGDSGVAVSLEHFGASASAAT